ncbi:MAG: hypothetical protein ABSG43_23955, partial [Solirubrobacteraceae bacterium]
MDSGDSAGGPGGAEPTSGDLSLSAADTVEISDDASAAGFDFDQHRARSVERYGAVRGDYEDWARAVHAVLATALHIEGVTIHSLEYRAKDVYSFGRKSETPDPSDPNRPKYSDPLTAITDMSRVRVITFLLSEVAKTCVVVEREFVVTEKTDK